MLKKFFVGLAVLALVGTLAASNAMAQIFVDNRVRTVPAEFVPDEILVKFKPGADVDAINRRLGAISASITYSGVYRVKVAPDRLDELLKAYNEDLGVEYAEPNYIAKAFWVPNDPLYPEQWHLDNSVYGGIEMEEAWDIEKGDPSVVVAVIDSGVAYEDYDGYCLAPDLADTAFVPGYDFVNNDVHPNDDNSHGTHVTGTIAQSTNNGEGVAGVAFNTSIMPVKVLDANGVGTYLWVADGVRWATDNGANIINMSLGGSLPSTTLKNACEYAYNNEVTIVAASGNDDGPVAYPAAYDDYVIAVGATRYDEKRAWYSNYGPSLDLVAPGGEDLFGEKVLQQTFSGDPCNFDYYFKYGTSMASPHVAGVAALVYAAGIATTPDDIRNVLQSTAEDKGALGWDEYYGWGLVNAYKALGGTPPLQPPVANADGPYEGVKGEPISFYGARSYDADGTIVSYEWDFGDGSVGTGATTTHTYAEYGKYIVTLTVTDNDGLTDTDDTTATVKCTIGVISSDAVVLKDLRQFRDNLLTKNETGQKFIKLYYQHSPEVTGILLKHPTLSIRSAAILKDVMPGIRFLLRDKKGRDIVLTPLLVARIKNLFFNLNKEGSEELVQTLKMLSNWLEKYEGMWVSQIWRAIDKKPEEFALLQNHPNPFNPDTWIPYQLSESATVTIRIYNVSGQLVRTLRLGTKPAGFYLTKDKAAHWDGRDSFGEEVASGVYFYTLQAGEFSATRKMLILK